MRKKRKEEINWSNRLNSNITIYAVNFNVICPEKKSKTMVRVTVTHLVKILTLALRVANDRKPHICTMFGYVWTSDLQKLSLDYATNFIFTSYIAVFPRSTTCT